MKGTILLVVCVIASVFYASAIGGATGSSKCLTSAGYTWCAFEGKCVRPWELAKAKGLEMSAENIEAYCAVKKVGGSQDSNGCISAAGYSWCAKENSCVRPWELASAKQISIKSESDFQNYCNNGTNSQQEVGNDKDSHSCIASAGYSWCKKENKCVKAWELLKSLSLESTPISFQTYCSDCLASAGYSYCYAQQKCIRPWELAKELSIDATPESIKSYCSQSPVSTKQRNIGGDSDNHGCMAGAGYSWCQKEGKCVQPWELASAKQLDNTPEAFEQYCNEVYITGPLIPVQGAPQNQPDNTVGGASDNHGCIAGAGYSWCAKENKCVRPWELAKEQNISGMTAESFQAYCSSQ